MDNSTASDVLKGSETVISGFFSAVFSTSFLFNFAFAAILASFGFIQIVIFQSMTNIDYASNAILFNTIFAEIINFDYLALGLPFMFDFSYDETIAGQNKEMFIK